MKSPHLTSAIFVLVLFAVLVLIGIGLVTWAGPAIRHGTMAEHDAGTIQDIRPDKSFTLKTASGQIIQFQCSERCLVQQSHMQRHKTEKAHTDVYFIRGANDTLTAIDVD